MTDWHDTLAQPLEAAEYGAEEAGDHFGSVHDGPLSFDHIDYPAAQVYLESFERSDPTNWSIAVSTTLYFAWSRDTSTSEDILRPLATVLSETLTAFEAVESITDYHPARIDFFSGEPSNQLVLAVSVQFRVTTLVDPGTFG